MGVLSVIIGLPYISLSAQLSDSYISAATDYTQVSIISLASIFLDAYVREALKQKKR